MFRSSSDGRHDTDVGRFANRDRIVGGAAWKIRCSKLSRRDVGAGVTAAEERREILAPNPAAWPEAG